MDGLDQELIRQIAGDRFAQMFFMWSTSLAVAAWVHSGRVKKEIRSQLSSITDAINNLAIALRQDLSVLSERVGKVENRVDKIESDKN